MNKWKDVSTYSQNDSTREPRIWQLQNEHLRISVHRIHMYDPKLWFVSCHDVLVNDVQLKSREVKLAQAEALDVIRKRLETMLKSVTPRKAAKKKGT